ncbi:hypothetical protein F383_31274 [Gossypium arboreum]|uniref:Uncharacterized protein n=1 Tax=Gossypium arboreum TaxID=29729 RepID=A0A0B0N1M6_GOSAR|nr:hypothetical protein F383_31274 [Gossypium arboreum]
MLHGHVSPGVEIKMKSVCSTRSYTWACDLGVLHKSVYPVGLARPSTRPSTRPRTRTCMAIFRAYRVATRACVLVV